MKAIKVGNKEIGEASPTYVIAEAGANHNGDVDLAKRHIREAWLSGADAIKFQIYKADKLVTRTAPIYWKVGNDEGKTQYDVFSKIHNFPIEFYKKCIDYANKIGITFFCTPFDLDAVDVMEEIGVKLYKVASGDITYHQLLKKIAQTGKPIVLSTGASTLGEIEEAVNIIEKENNSQIILLHCTLAYPTPQKDINLNMIPTLAKLFPDYPIGLSDHTFSPLTPALSVMVGAKVIEKHFTVDKTLEGSSDHKLGVDPYQLKCLVESIRLAEASLGGGMKRPEDAEKPALMMARRSLVSTQNIKKGEKITKQMLTAKRPGTGIQPKLMEEIIGLTSKKDIKEDSIFTWNMVKDPKIDVIIQARMGSVRFPGKTLKKIKDKTLLERVIDRANKIRGISEIIVATTNRRNDEAIVDHCKKLGVSYYVGSETDVLNRLVKASQEHSSDIVIRLTADNPFLEPSEIDSLIQKHLKNENDYTLSFGYPLGSSGEVFGVEGLIKVSNLTKDKLSHEHPGVYFLNHPEEFKIEADKAPKKRDFPEIRLTIDVPKDFKTAENIIDKLGENFTIDDIIALYRKNNKLFTNRKVEQEKPSMAFKKIFSGENPF